MSIGHLEECPCGRDGLESAQGAAGTGDRSVGQVGCFDVANRYAGLDAKKDPLARIDALVPWEHFRPRLEAVWRVRPGDRKSPAGRKPWDAGGDVQGGRALRAVRPLGRSGGVPAAGPPFVHALPGARPRGRGARCEDGVALPRATGPGGRDRGAVRGVRRAPEGAGLAGDGRPDRRRRDRTGAEAAEYA